MDISLIIGIVGVLWLLGICEGPNRLDIWHQQLELWHKNLVKQVMAKQGISQKQAEQIVSAKLRQYVQEAKGRKQ